MNRRGWSKRSWRAGSRFFLPILWVAFVVGYASFPPAFASVIQTRDQKEYRGDIAFQPDGSILLRTNGVEGTAIAWKEIDHVRFSDASEQLPDSGWQSADIGNVYASGSTRIETNSLRLIGTGWGWWNATDAFRFAGVGARGDSEIIAQVASFHDSNGIVFAGVTIRGDLSPAAEHVTLVVSPEGKVRIKARPSGTEVRINRDGIYWLRLRRMGEQVIAYISDDGQRWEPVQELAVPSGAELRAGIVTATVINAFVGGATFSNVVVRTSSGNSFEDLPTSGVVLTDGSVLAGKPEIQDLTTLKLLRRGKKWELPWSRVAAILLRPAPWSVIQPAASARSGVMMAGSDFLEGEIASIGINAVTINSVLFGLKKIALDDKPVAIVTAGIRKGSGSWEVRLTDDSLIYCDEPGANHQALTIRHPFLGTLTLALEEIAEISSPSRTGIRKAGLH